jgi:nicotinamide-nucleotide amidase
MKALIVSIGDELVLGQTLDTNSAWIAARLAELGCDVAAHVTVGDDKTAIESLLRQTLQRDDPPDLLLISGGLGPTEDDLTREALADTLGVGLTLHEPWLEQIRTFFRQRGREMPRRNSVQAMIPTGAELIWNDHGTAAGIDARFERAGRAVRVLAMPGVPGEMKPMFEKSVRPIVSGASVGAVILQRTLHTFGLGESSVAERLGDLMRRDRNPSVGTTVSEAVVSLRINARFASVQDAINATERTIAECRAALGNLIYGADGQTLAQAVAQLLTQEKGTVATAESCTGGLVAKYLTDIPGSSQYFQQGFVVYSNEAKRQRLGVNENLLHVHGAVSEPVVLAMARGARRLAGSSYALAISGIAGPDGGTPTKPVGTVCIALAHLAPATRPLAKGVDREDEVNAYARTFNLPGDRAMIRDRAAKTALAMLRFRLLGEPLPF